MNSRHIIHLVCPFVKVVISLYISSIVHMSLQWRHNELTGVSNHLPHDCLLNRLFRSRSKKHEISASVTFVWGIHRWPVNSPHKGPVTRKMFPFDDVIICHVFVWLTNFLRTTLAINVFSLSMSFFVSKNRSPFVVRGISVCWKV